MKKPILLRRIALGLAIVPALIMIVDGALGRLGKNPIEELMNRLGYWALFFVMLSLTCTPIKIVTGNSSALQMRRTLGLTGFFYALAHFLNYLVVDQFFDWPEIIKDLTQRPFIIFGATAFTLLIPAALTSTDKWVVRLGAQRWKMIHRLIYASAGIAVLHYVFRVKADFTAPAIFGAWWAVVMLVRLVAAAKPRGSVPA